MNYYVVETFREAMQAISLLSDASKGRANFFVLEAFKDYNLSPQEKQENLIPALGIIECEEKYKALCHYLLHRVFLVPKNREEETMGSTGREAILLGESGKYAKGRYSISGGFVGLFEGKRIGRARNLDVLQKEIKKLDRELEELATNTEELQQTYNRLKGSTKTAEISSMRAVHNRLSGELLTLQTRESQHREFIGNSTLRKEDIEQKLAQYMESLTVLVPKLETLEEEKLQAASHQERAAETHRQLSEDVNGVSSQFNQQNIQFHQQKNKLDGILKDLDYQQADLERYQSRIEKNITELDITRQEIGKLLQQGDGADEDLQAMYKQKEAMENGLREAEEDYYAGKGIIGKLEEELTQLRRQKEQSGYLSTELKDKKTQLKIDLNSLKERLSVSFNVDIEELLEQENTPEGDENELQASSEKLKHQLDNRSEEHTSELQSLMRI